MAIEGPVATVPLSPGKRLDGLNHIAELRAKVFGLNIEREMDRFINEMRDPRDINHKQNERALVPSYSSWQKFRQNVTTSILMS